MLKQKGINVNSKDDEGRTLLALSLANITLESVDLVSHLLKEENEADPNSQDAKGRAPLYHLVQGMV